MHEIGERVVWLRKGVAVIDAVKESAGETFWVVKPFGWTGEPAWVAQRSSREQIRPLVSREVATRWLAQLEEPTTPRDEGDLVMRRKRALRTVEHGTSEQQVAALAHLYRETHRPDVDDVTTIDALERLVLFEIACVLDTSIDTLRAMFHEAPRFSEDAPRSGTIREPTQAPLLPDGWEHIGAFTVKEALHVTDLMEMTETLRARPGRWHGIHKDASFVALHESQLAQFPLAGGEPVGTKTESLRRLCFLDDGAETDPLVVEEIWDCDANEIRGRGVVMYWQASFNFRAWKIDGACVAFEAKEAPYDDDDDDDDA
jgi:hypothetical protein